MHQKTRFERFLSDLLWGWRYMVILEPSMFLFIIGTLEHVKMRSPQDMGKTFIDFLCVLFLNVFCHLGIQKRSCCKRKIYRCGIFKILLHLCWAHAYFLVGSYSNRWHSRRCLFYCTSFRRGITFGSSELHRALRSCKAEVRQWKV